MGVFTILKAESNGLCGEIDACQMCGGNSFVINYICENGTTIPAEETQIADGTSVYTFPFEKVFALQEAVSGNIVDSDTIRDSIYSIVNKSIDTPTTCEVQTLYLR